MPDLAPGQPPPPLFFPPFPNEEKMRRGRLNAEAPLGPLGETHPIGQGISIYMFYYFILQLLNSLNLSSDPVSRETRVTRASTGSRLSI